MRVFLTAVAALALTTSASACPFCRDAIASADRAFARGWNASVLLLLALVPLALLVLTLASQRARREHGTRRTIEGRPRWPAA